MTAKTYQNIYKELLNCISHDDILTDISVKFKTWNTDAERVADCYSLLVYYNLLPDLTVTGNEKSAAESEKLKNLGNRAFINKDDYLALYYYTRCITYAPVDSKLISIAYANRSAVTFSLNDYSDSVVDIDRALSGEYPEHLKFKLLERKGKALAKLGKLFEAGIAFQAAIEHLPRSNLDKEKINFLCKQLQLHVEDCKVSSCQDSYIPKKSYPELTHGHNPNIQSGSSAVDIDYSPAMGRFLVATQDILPGDVLAIERPYSSITLPSSYFSHCFYCQKRCHSMLPCPTCTMVCFCDESCREKSWEDSHSIECSILKPLLQLNCGKMELLSLRVLINATKKGRLLSKLASSVLELESFIEPRKKGFTGEIYLSDSYRSIHNLEGNTNLRDVSYLFCRSVITCCILHILDTHTTFFEMSNLGTNEVNSNSTFLFGDFENKCDLNWEKVFAGGLLLKYLQSMASNAHEVSEMRLIPTSDGNKVLSSEIGSAAYPLLSLINHSCDPNVVRHSHMGSTVVLTAIQLIKKGEQIFDNYGFHHATHTKEERDSHLRSQYHFICQCVACTEAWPLYRDIPCENPRLLLLTPAKDLTKSSKNYKVILDKLTQEKYQEINPEVLNQWLSSLYSHLKLLQKNIKRPWQEFSGCQEVIKQCLSFLANHYFYKSSPQSLINLTDIDTSVSPF